MWPRWRSPFREPKGGTTIPSNTAGRARRPVLGIVLRGPRSNDASRAAQRGVNGSLRPVRPWSRLSRRRSVAAVRRGDQPGALGLMALLCPMQGVWARTHLLGLRSATLPEPCDPSSPWGSRTRSQGRQPGMAQDRAGRLGRSLLEAGGPRRGHRCYDRI